MYTTLKKSYSDDNYDAEYVGDAEDVGDEDAEYIGDAEDNNDTEYVENNEENDSNETDYYVHDNINTRFYNDSSNIGYNNYDGSYIAPYYYNSGTYDGGLYNGYNGYYSNYPYAVNSSNDYYPIENAYPTNYTPDYIECSKKNNCSFIRIKKR
jgi:hypothetical protein